MLCPCCGIELAVESRECGCGARFVGAPLDEKPVKVTLKSYGQVMNATGLFAAVTAATFLFTKFFALGAIVILWYTWRVIKRTRRQPELYGGYRVATAILTVTLIAGIAAIALTVANIPNMMLRKKLRRDAATQASMYEVKYQLDEYNRLHGTYPLNAQEYAKATNQPLPLDSWQHQIKYTSFTESIALTAPPSRDGKVRVPQNSGMSLNNFELRSNGPDELPNTDDDIIMRDGIFYTAAELKNQITVKTSTKK